LLAVGCWRLFDVVVIEVVGDYWLVVGDCWRLFKVN